MASKTEDMSLPLRGECIPVATGLLESATVYSTLALMDFDRLMPFQCRFSPRWRRVMARSEAELRSELRCVLDSINSLPVTLARLADCVAAPASPEKLFSFQTLLVLYFMGRRLEVVTRECPVLVADAVAVGRLKSFVLDLKERLEPFQQSTDWAQRSPIAASDDIRGVLQLCQNLAAIRKSPDAPKAMLQEMDRLVAYLQPHLNARGLGRVPHACFENADIPSRGSGGFPLNIRDSFAPFERMARATSKKIFNIRMRVYQPVDKLIRQCCAQVPKEKANKLTRKVNDELKPLTVLLYWIKAKRTNRQLPRRRSSFNKIFGTNKYEDMDLLAADTDDIQPDFGHIKFVHSPADLVFSEGRDNVWPKPGRDQTLSRSSLRKPRSTYDSLSRQNASRRADHATGSLPRHLDQSARVGAVPGIRKAIMPSEPPYDPTPKINEDYEVVPHHTRQQSAPTPQPRSPPEVGTFCDIVTTFPRTNTLPRDHSRRPVAQPYADDDEFIPQTARAAPTPLLSLQAPFSGTQARLVAPPKPERATLSGHSTLPRIPKPAAKPTPPPRLPSSLEQSAKPLSGTERIASSVKIVELAPEVVEVVTTPPAATPAAATLPPPPPRQVPAEPTQSRAPAQAAESVVAPPATPAQPAMPITDLAKAILDARGTLKRLKSERAGAEEEELAPPPPPRPATLPRQATTQRSVASLPASESAVEALRRTAPLGTSMQEISPLTAPKIVGYVIKKEVAATPPAPKVLGPILKKPLNLRPKTASVSSLPPAAATLPRAPVPSATLSGATATLARQSAAARSTVGPIAKKPLNLRPRVNFTEPAESVARNRDSIESLDRTMQELEEMMKVLSDI